MAEEANPYRPPGETNEPKTEDAEPNTSIESGLLAHAITGIIVVPLIIAFVVMASMFLA